MAVCLRAMLRLHPRFFSFYLCGCCSRSSCCSRSIDYVILPFTAAIAKVSVWHRRPVRCARGRYGKILQSTSNNFAISIERGCNGVEAVIILVSAMLAFPAPWKHRLIGIGLGFVAIQALNLVRIISLFYLGQWNRIWFDWFHLYLWQALIVLDALVAFLIWLRYLPRQSAPRDGGRLSLATPLAIAGNRVGAWRKCRGAKPMALRVRLCYSGFGLDMRRIRHDSLQGY